MLSFSKTGIFKRNLYIRITFLQGFKNLIKKKKIINTYKVLETLQEKTKNMLTSKKDEIQQRLNSILQKLSGITFVPENWKEDVFWTTLEETGLSKSDVLEKEENLLFTQLIDLQFPWEHMEKLADILVGLDAKQPNQLLKERAKHLYEFIQKESKMFSFEIMNKIGKL
ncbi:hypothetical protein SAMN02927937_02648 [Paenimyroides aquimaris]|uniref:Uncharacterized protein n=2 Tax=Paenimyroides marinum TaxID=1159016 RepID=A0A1H6MEP1_9FLAO|nr:hypothetical protein SAMN02927937_02648 [Paenimyroides aquimaris]